MTVQSRKILIRGVQLPKITLVQTSFTKLTAVSVCQFAFALCFVECVCTLLRAFQFTAFVKLIVSRTDSELEAQRYGMKKSTLTVDPIILEDEL